MKRRLIVSDDWVESAAELFSNANPRTVALAGGATPAPLYERLADLPRDWTATHVFFTDERCVPRDHPDSNYAMAFNSLLRRVPARVHEMDGERCDDVGYERELIAVFGLRLPEFDLMMLGLGADGHTASLFPGDPAIDETQARVVAVQRADHQRLTLTLPVLSAARHVVFLAIGGTKANALRAMLDNSDCPAARVAAKRITIVADPQAAAQLSLQERQALLLPLSQGAMK